MAMRRVSVLSALSLVLSVAGCAPEGTSAYVSFVVPPGPDCVVSPTATEFIATGTFDIIKAGVKDPTPGVKAADLPQNHCSNPYRIAMLVNSNLRPNANAATGRAEPNILKIESAEVKLMNLERVPIRFDRKDKDNPLPNPFVVTANNTLGPASGTEASVGVVAVEAIPVAYAAQLDKFRTEQILAEVQIFGTTIGDVDVDFKPFTFPVQLCWGCLYMCSSKLVTEMLDPSEVYGDECPDDAGADGRICIDPNC
jgi:hypothetical protein